MLNVYYNYLRVGSLLYTVNSFFKFIFAELIIIVRNVQQFIKGLSVCSTAAAHTICRHINDIHSSSVKSTLHSNELSHCYSICVCSCQIEVLALCQFMHACINWLDHRIKRMTKISIYTKFVIITNNIWLYLFQNWLGT